MYKLFFKRVVDIFIVLSILALLWPIIGITAILLAFFNKGSGVFFRQVRPGKDGKLFSIVKFKTMSDEKDENGKLLPDIQRITKFGSFVRKSSIDELPQLWNVLKGDMSLIGPRPLLTEYLPLYSAEQMRRHNVRPGITGWAQVNGRNNISWCKKFELHVWYVDHISFWLDIKIVFKTILKILKRADINNEVGDKKVTTPLFNGKN